MSNLATKAWKVLLTSVIWISILGTSLGSTGLAVANQIPGVENTVAIEQSTSEKTNNFLGSLFSVPTASAAEYNYDRIYTREDLPFKDKYSFNNDDIPNFVGKMAEAQIIKGYSDGTFKPQRNVSNFEGLKIIIKTGPNGYQVSPNSWDSLEGSQYFRVYQNNDYTSQYNLQDTAASYNQNMTRGFAMYLMLRQLGINLEKADYYKMSAQEFSDVNYNTPFSEYIRFAREVGIVNGNGNKFTPNNGVTRGEISKMTWKTLKWDTSAIMNKYREIKAKEGSAPSTPTYNQPSNPSPAPAPSTPTSPSYDTNSGISSALQSKLNANVSKKNSYGQVTQYDNIKFDSAEQFAEFVTKVKVKADPGSLPYGKQVSQYRQNGKVKGWPNEGRYYSDSIKASILYSWMTGQDANGNQVGQGYTWEIPAFAAVNISTQWNSNAQGGDLGRYRTYGSISTPTAYTSSELNSLLKGWGKLNIVPSVVAPGFEFGMRENDMRSLEAEFSKSSSAKSKYSSAQQMISTYNGSGITQDVYNKLVSLGLNTSEWQVQGTSIVYLPSRLSFDTWFVGGNVGDYAIKIDLSLSAISFAASTGQLGSSTFRVGGPEVATRHDAYGFTSPLYLVSGVR